MKEEFTINKPHIANEFARLFHEHASKEPTQPQIYSTAMSARSGLSSNVAKTKSLIVDDDYQESNAGAGADDDSYCLVDIHGSISINANRTYRIGGKDLALCLTKLGNMITERERSNFEQYTLFYESLLRQQHSLLYSKERQVKAMQDAIDAHKAQLTIEVQCEMADTCYDLIVGE